MTGSVCIIGGADMDVENDERAGRLLSQQCVFGGYCRQTK